MDLQDSPAMLFASPGELSAMIRPALLAASLLLVAPALGGCVVTAVAGAATSVAATGVKAGAKVVGAGVGLAADGVGAAGRAVTGSGRR